MRILLEILHPAHVHVFKHAVRTWRERGDEVLVFSRDKDCANELLQAYGIPFRSISTLGRSKWALAAEMMVRDFRMLRAALKFKPDILVGIMGVTIVQVGRLIGKPAVVFYDTENSTLTNYFVYPLAHSVCTPRCYNAPVRGRHVTYPGYHELAYLHPDRFRADGRAVEALGIDPAEDFFIVRFVSWQASHDIHEHGLSLDFKRRIVAELSQRGRVLITSEGPLPADLEPYRFPLPADRMHDVLAFARLLVGESATMASEAAVLGVPAVYISNTGRGYTDDEETFGLVFNFTTGQEEEVIARIDSLLSMPNARQTLAERRKKLLESRVDTTTWMVDYIDGVVKGDDGPPP